MVFYLPDCLRSFRLQLLLLCVGTGGSMRISWIGCYEDSAERDLESGPRKYGYTTESCAVACQGFKFMALQDGGYCACGDRYSNSLRHEQVADNECSAVCTGEEMLTPARYCGAEWRNAVYQIVVVTDALPAALNPAALPICSSLRGPGGVGNCAKPLCGVSCNDTRPANTANIAAADSADAAAVEHAKWVEAVAPWNNSFSGPGHYPIAMPNEAACRFGPTQVINPQSHGGLLSQRYVSMKESGYGVCPQPSLRRPGCIIYSCGVDEDPTFEIQMARTTRCEVFAFDPSPVARRWMGYLVATLHPPLPRNLHFIPWGWSGRDTVVDVDPWSMIELTGKCGNCFWPWDTKEWGEPPRKWQLLRLSTIARRLNHSKVDLVKMDCEGPEYGDQFIEDMIALRPEQIVLEQHPLKQVVNGRTNLTSERVSSAEWVRVQEKLHAAGFRQVWLGRLFNDLTEYTLARRELTTLADQP